MSQKVVMELTRFLMDMEASRRRAEALEMARNLNLIAHYKPLLVEHIKKVDDREDMARKGRVWLMELGELDKVSLPGGTVRRVLYLGSDCRFYVYGPTSFHRKTTWLIDRASYGMRDVVKFSLRQLPVGDSTPARLVSRVRDRVLQAFI